MAPTASNTNHNLEAIVHEAATTSEAVTSQEDRDGYDSGFEESYSDSDGSVTGSVIAGVDKYGRNYQNPSEYPLPQDATEHDRLDFAHHVFSYFMNKKLCYAPLRQVHNVLDIGTGTGIWAIDFAEEYKSASVLGIDICCSQPTNVPPNCHFQIYDLEKVWNFRRKFDFIHIRQPTGFKLFNNVIESAYQSLVCGGWLEIQDIMFRLQCDSSEPPHLRLWEKDVLDGARHLQYDLEKPYEALMRNQGFKEIKCIVKKWPIWHSQETDKWFLTLALDRIEPYSLIHLLEGPEAEIWTLTGVKAQIGKVKQDIRAHKGHLSLQTIVIYGQK